MLKLRVTKICSIENCIRRMYARTWCRLHYDRWLEHGDPLTLKQIRGDDEKRFWSYVDKDGPTMPLMDTPCWEWRGSLSQAGGYGHVRIAGHTQQAHRYAFFLEHGHYTVNHTLHHCDNRACVRASHLYDGTNLDNSRDMIARNRQRHPSGEDHVSSKLTNEQVLDIRHLFANGEDVNTIAAIHKTTSGNVYMVGTGRSWKHLL